MLRRPTVLPTEVDDSTSHRSRASKPKIVRRALKIGGLSIVLVTGLSHVGSAFGQNPPLQPAPMPPGPAPSNGAAPAAVPAPPKPLTAEELAAQKAKELKEKREKEEQEATAIAAQAETVLKEQDLSRREQLTKEVLDRTSSLSPSEMKNALLRRLTRSFSTQEDTRNDARKAALAIDQPAIAERARALVVLAKAEATAGQTQQAWWTLHEAQELALKLTDEQEIIGVFREIGAVEGSLQGGTSTTANGIIETVIQNGLPPKGYQEIDIIRAGGGPLRESTVIKHTYYYNGDRVYQGPNFKGGPAVVQVVHPKTGCPTQVHLNMPAGAPLIEHDDDFIRYHFPNVYMTVRFHSDGCSSVSYGHHLNNYDAMRRKIESRDLTPSFKSKDNSGTGNVARNLIETRLGGPIDVARRLPVLSDVLNKDEKRIPNTLQDRAKSTRLPDAIRRK